MFISICWGAFAALQFTVYTIAVPYGELMEICRILDERAEKKYRVQSAEYRVKDKK
jgi:hypothetical protein